MVSSTTIKDRRFPYMRRSNRRMRTRNGSRNGTTQEAINDYSTEPSCILRIRADTPDK